jgi:phage-related minor tail protein
MADATSTIRVKIEGDAKGLSNELQKSDKAVGGLGVSMGKLAGAFALGAVAAGVAEFGSTALAEADRLGDATSRLELQLGDLSDELVTSAENFASLGGSAQDVLELEAAFADAATAVQLSDEAIVRFADDAAATALAIALLTWKRRRSSTLSARRPAVAKRP